MNLASNLPTQSFNFFVGFPCSDDFVVLQLNFYEYLRLLLLYHFQIFHSILVNIFTLDFEQRPQRIFKDSIHPCTTAAAVAVEAFSIEIARPHNFCIIICFLLTHHSDCGTKLSATRNKIKGVGVCQRQNIEAIQQKEMKARICKIVKHILVIFLRELSII